MQTTKILTTYQRTRRHTRSSHTINTIDPTLRQARIQQPFITQFNPFKTPARAFIGQMRRFNALQTRTGHFCIRPRD